jgi:CubicO group peptidase (beta-lactamase class C family)
MANVLQPYVDRGELAGAVTLVADANKVLSLECVGYADIAAKKPMQPNTLFWIASQTKPMTTTAMMMLMDEGKVCAEDLVEKYLPEFKGQWRVAERDDTHVLLKKPSRPITVRDILSHTSGLPFASAMEVPTLDLLPLRECALSYAMTPLQSEPGSKYEYSNAGINTAGRIIELVSGMSYTDFMNTRLFQPLGMIDTTFVPTEEQVSRLTKCYQPAADKTGLEEIRISQLKYPLNDTARQPMPAGGLFSTATDCGRFMQMVLNKGTFEGKRYLSPQAVAMMTSKQTPLALGDQYGFGWSSGETFGHGGACATNMIADTKLGMVAVYLIQHTNGFPGEGGKAQETFMTAAKSRFLNA